MRWMASLSPLGLQVVGRAGPGAGCGVGQTARASGAGVEEGAGDCGSPADGGGGHRGLLPPHPGQDVTDRGECGLGVAPAGRDRGPSARCWPSCVRLCIRAVLVLAGAGPAVVLSGGT